MSEGFEIKDTVSPVLAALKTQFARCGKLLNKAAVRLQAEMVLRTAGNKGRAGAQSIQRKLEWDGPTAFVRVGSNFKASRFFNYGTGIYGPRHARIYPKTAKALSWISGTYGTFKGTASRAGMALTMRQDPATGKVSYSLPKAKSVTFNPRITVLSTKGMKAVPFLEPSLEIVSREFKDDIIFEVKNGFDKAKSGEQGME